jgi:phosphoglycerate dehydrogenase-like enzyme
MGPAPSGEMGGLRIAFLDDDHVMKLTRLMLSAGDRAEEEWLRGFFTPEPVDVPRLLELGAGLRRADGAEVVLVDPRRPQSVAGSTVLVFRRGRVTAETMDACPDLRLIQRLGEDASSVDLDAARERGIEVSCLPRRSLHHAAEHAVMLMLALSKRLLVADRAVRTVEPGAASSSDGVAYNWVGLTGIGGLAGRTLGIVGLGEVGVHLATRAHALGMRLLYADRRRLAPDREEALHVELRSLDELLEGSDYVSLHVPGTGANERLIGAPQLARMRPRAYLVNTSRGPVVDEDALYEALVERRIAGAGLDVHAHEPRPAADRFCRLDNVILTPHVSGGSRLDTVAEVEAMFDNVRAVLAGQPPPHGGVSLGTGDSGT